MITEIEPIKEKVIAALNPLYVEEGGIEHNIEFAPPRELSIPNPSIRKEVKTTIFKILYLKVEFLTPYKSIKKMNSQ